LNKPSPQIFLLTAEKLGVEPYECLVFEDSGVGVEAALSAGMAVIGIAENKEEAQHLAAAQKISVIFAILNFCLPVPEKKLTAFNRNFYLRLIFFKKKSFWLFEEGLASGLIMPTESIFGKWRRISS